MSSQCDMGGNIVQFYFCKNKSVRPEFFSHLSVFYIKEGPFALVDIHTIHIHVKGEKSDLRYVYTATFKSINVADVFVIC